MLQELLNRWNQAVRAYPAFDRSFAWDLDEAFPLPTFRGGNAAAYTMFAGILAFFLRNNGEWLLSSGAIDYKFPIWPVTLPVGFFARLFVRLALLVERLLNPQGWISFRHLHVLMSLHRLVSPEKRAELRRLLVAHNEGKEV